MAFMAPLMFGSAATATAAATTGLIGTGGAFALMPAISTAGTLLSTLGSISQGKSASVAAKYEAEQLEQKAGQERAASQRKAIEMRRRAGIAESRALALAAASGGGASDPTITNLMAGIAGEGELAAQTAIYEGEERARGAEMGAEAKRYEGKSAKRAGYLSAGATLLSGAAKLGTGLTAKYAPSAAPATAYDSGIPEWSWD